MSSRSITVQSPGRINIIGEHTDYNEGFVLPAAVDKVSTFSLTTNDSNEVYVKSLNMNNHLRFRLDQFSPLEGGWQNYVMGTVHELQKLGCTIKGFDGEFRGDVPIGGGMSSSAALECSLAYGLNELFDLKLSKWQIIKAAQMAEHNFVGIKCGIMDQFASVMGKKGKVMMLDCRSLEFEYIPLELGHYEILLINTNVSHALASSEYNVRREEAHEGVAIIQKNYPDLKLSSLRNVTAQMLERCKEQLTGRIYDRCHHVVFENQRVLDAREALQDGNLEQLGDLIYASHDSLQHKYEVSCDELDFLVDYTMNKDYVLGSRMMGGGFGGCTISLVRSDQKELFLSQVLPAYEKNFGKHASPVSVAIGDGSRVVC